MLLARLAIYLLGVTLALVLLVVLFLFTVDLGRFKPQVLALADHFLERPLEIDGALSLTLDVRDGARLRLEGLRLASAPWDEGPDLFALDGLSARLDLKSLFGDGPILVDTVSIEGPRAHLVQDAQGRNNWTLFPPAADEDGDEEEEGEGEEQLPEELEGDRFRLPVWVADLQLTDGLFHLSTPGLVDPLELVITRASLAQDKAEQVVLALAGKVGPDPLRVDFNAGSKASLISLRELELKLDGELGEVGLRGRVSLEDALDPFRPSAQLEVSGPRFEDLLAALGLPELSRGPLRLSLASTPSVDGLGLVVEGELGEFLLAADARVNDLRSAEQAHLLLSGSGPDAGRLVGAFGAALLPAEPYRFRAVAVRDGSDFKLDELLLTIGDARLVADGQLLDFPEPGGMSLKALLEVPEIGHFAGPLGLAGERHGPLRLEASVRDSDAADSALLTARGSGLGAELRADGELIDHPDFLGSRLGLSIEGSNIARVLALFAPDLPASGAYRLRADAALAAGGVALQGLEAALGDDLLQASGQLALDPLAGQSQIKYTVEVPAPLRSLANFGVEVPGLPATPLAVRGSLEAEEGLIALKRNELEFAGATLSITGLLNKLPDLDGSDIELAASGEDLRSVWDGVDFPPGLARPFSLESGLSLRDGRLSLNDARFEVAGTHLVMDASIDPRNPLSWGEFRLKGGSEAVDALLPGDPATAAAKLPPLSLVALGEWRDSVLQLRQLDASLGADSVSGHGTLALPDKGRSRLALTGKLESLQAWSPYVGRELPDVPASLDLELSGEGRSYRVRPFDARVGESDLGGEFSLTFEDTAAMTLSLRSRLLDVTPFLPAPPEETAGAGEQSAASLPPVPGSSSRSAPAAAEKRLIPDTPIPMEALGAYTAELEIAIDELKVEAHRLRAVTLDGSLGGGRLYLDNLALTTPRGGKLQGAAALLPWQDRTELLVRLRGDTLNIGFPAATPEELADLPLYTINLALASRGATVRELASAANGYLRVVVGTGRFKGDGLRFVTNDFITQLVESVNPFSATDPYTNISCANVLVAVEGGQVVGEPVLVIQTDRLNILSNAKVDLASEKMAVYFKTVPQKGLGISVTTLVNPYVMVSGTLAQPAVSLDAPSAAVQGVAAVATGGLSILVKGLADRFFSEDDPCGHTLVEADKGLREIEEKYARKDGTGVVFKD